MINYILFVKEAIDKIKIWSKNEKYHSCTSYNTEPLPC